MARNTGRGYRKGSVRQRSQIRNPRTSRWVKRNSETGRFIDGKADSKPFKGIAKER